MVLPHANADFLNRAYLLSCIGEIKVSTSSLVMKEATGVVCYVGEDYQRIHASRMELNSDNAYNPLFS